MKKIAITLLAISTLFLTGCATVLSGTTQTLTFTSDVKGVEVYVDGILVGETPVSAVFKKNKAQNVLFKKDGYKSETRQLVKSFDPITVFSLFWDYSTTDMITGAAFKYAPDAIFVEMKVENNN